MMTDVLSIQTARLSNLVTLYKIYFDTLHENEVNWTKLKLDTPQTTPKLIFRRVLVSRLVSMLFARLHAVARTGSNLAILQTRWDPIILEVLAGGKLIGCCFVERQSDKVFQISVIASIKSEQQKWMEHDVLVAVKKYLKMMGATRIFVRVNTEKMKSVLKTGEFKFAFRDSILYIDI